MTVSTPTHETKPLPPGRLGLTWLLTNAGRLRAWWTSINQRGQLGTAHAEPRHDRHLAPYDRVSIPRVY